MGRSSDSRLEKRKEKVMASSQYNLSVVLRGIDKLSGPIRGATGAMKKFNLGGIAAAAGVSGSILAAAGAINKLASEGERLAKTASVLGLTAEELQELQFAADLSGV